MKNMKVRSRNSMFLTGRRTQVLCAVLAWSCVLMATPALWSSPTIQFSPSGAGHWEYDGAGTLKLFQNITVDVGLGSGTDALVGASVYIPDLSVGGIPAGPYTLTPLNSPGTIIIKSPDNTKTYLTGTLGPGELFPIGTTGLSYTNFQVDITNVAVTDDGRALGSDALDAIDSAQCPLDFTLTLNGATGGFKKMLEDGATGEDSFSGDMTIKCPECQLEVTKEGCVITSGANQCYKGNKVKSMILEYTGQGCGASSHSQDPAKVKCSGDPSFAEPVNILATDKKYTKNWGSASTIPVGGHVLVDAANEGKDRLDSETLVIITNTTGDVLQEVAFHTSCSQPLSVGDQFGSMRLISLTTTEGGTVSSDTCITEIPATGAEVEYTYTITNTGTTTVTGVTVIDDVFGAVPGSPIASILPGNSHTLTMTVPMTEAATNTVVVTAAEGCTANATATITKAPPEPTECTTKVQAMLLEYIGPEITDATVEFLPNNKKFKNKPVVYANINLIPGTVLSLATENNWTIDSLAHDTGDLGSKVSILINNVAEVIHTSCSTPFVSDKPAPLDNPKGVPSPNWFVVDFRQK